MAEQEHDRSFGTSGHHPPKLVTNDDFVETVTVISETVRSIGVRFDKTDHRIDRLMLAVALLLVVNVVLLALLVVVLT